MANMKHKVATLTALAIAAAPLSPALAQDAAANARAYLARIAALDDTIHAVIVTNPDAPAEAAAAEMVDIIGEYSPD